MEFLVRSFWPRPKRQPLKLHGEVWNKWPWQIGWSMWLFRIDTSTKLKLKIFQKVKMRINLVLFLLLLTYSSAKRTRKRSRRKRNHVIEENIPHGNGFIPMKLYASKKKGFLCLGEQTIMKWTRCTIQIQHQVLTITVNDLHSRVLFAK